MVMFSKFRSNCAIESKTTRRSYFALIPVFNKREQGNVEKNVIKFILKSDVCSSNPILRTLIIENVRICCIVVETSGKQSVKILCASVPYIFHLMCKANPKLKSILTNDKIASCLKLIQEQDFEALLENVYRTTVIIQKGVKKYYPTVTVSMIKNSAFFSEKSASYMFNVVLKFFQDVFGYLYDHFVPFLQSLYKQNIKSLRYVYDNLPQLANTCIKFSTSLSRYLQKFILAGFVFLKRLFMSCSHLLQYVYLNPTLIKTSKQIYLLLKTFKKYIRESVAYSLMEKSFIDLFNFCKPYITNNFHQILEFIKSNYQFVLPALKNIIRYIINHILPILRTVFENYKDSLINVSDIIFSFACENFDYFKLFFHRSFQLIRRYIKYLYDVSQTVIPHIIELSYTATIHLFSCLNCALAKVIYIAQALYTSFNSEYFKELFCDIFKQFFHVLKLIYQALINVKPFMVQMFRHFYCRLLEMIHKLSPTLKEILYEMISSIFSASKEVVSKSCLAVRNISPSIWYTTKTVLPPTISAVNEIFNASKNSLIIVSPTLWKSILAIRPELKDCVIVLSSDGRNACLEVITVSYYASCEIKDTMKTVSKNVPVVYRAMSEILITTNKAAIEVTKKSLNAKSKVRNDVVRIRKVIWLSILLAEEEILAAYSEISSIFCDTEKKSAALDDKGITNFARDTLNTIFSTLARTTEQFKQIFQKSIPVLADINEYLLIYMKYISFYIITSAVLSIYKFGKLLKMTKADELVIKQFLKLLSNVNFQQFSEHAANKFLDVSSELLFNICIAALMFWKTTKLCTKKAWTKACQQAPKMWDMLQHICENLWNFTVDHTPEAWMAWKKLTFAIWELICYATPHFWHFCSTISPVLWNFGRQRTKSTWNTFIKYSILWWQQYTSLTSECWLISVYYVPPIWMGTRKKTNATWDLACCLTENCWNSAVETCLLSWNFLHKAVAKSWNKSLVLTRTAYKMYSTAGLMFKKSICVCFRTKSYVYVLFAPASDESNSNSDVIISKVSATHDHDSTTMIDSLSTPAISQSCELSTKKNLKKCMDILPKFRISRMISSGVLYIIGSNHMNVITQI